VDDFTCQIASKLSTVWESGDYYDKQNFQNVLLPSGLLYDTKIEHYRTPKVNSFFGHIAELSGALEQNKSRTSHFFNEKSGSVPCGLDLSNFLVDFQSVRMLTNVNVQFPKI
jgi:hypothetical protein